MVAILSNKREVIFDAVRAMYTAVAISPEKGFHFPTGRTACEYVGYPTAVLDVLPAATVESFAGVGYPFAAEVLQPGDTRLPRDVSVRRLDPRGGAESPRLFRSKSQCGNPEGGGIIRRAHSRHAGSKADLKSEGASLAI